ncbi:MULTISPECIES: efflux RND transporter permease subunit [Pseudomonas]|uniref:efflux RND transporter permease subunit n=1 Tax=Pseudomonas TaxID=286 RepID=UPI0015C03C4B|nr:MULTISPECIES: MMPL family transporter [Pseudomonas]MDH4846100.1 RND family transporter [Pseudomonas sp. BN605]MDH4858772.1 RND family transporter [Pseudomonas sp. BN505]NWL08051.1 RND transporter [Pseudomonas hunanensis]
MDISKNDAMPVVPRVEEFDGRSGSFLERLVFNHRIALVVLCALTTVFLFIQAWQLEVNASFKKMMPISHPFIQNYEANAEALRGLGNALRVVVENPKGDIYDPHYLEMLKEINDRLFLLPGVDRSFMKSLWMPVVRWTEITEQGFDGGPVMPETFDGSPEALNALRDNVHRAGIIGSLVANDQHSSMLFLPLLERDGASGVALDYRSLGEQLDAIKQEYSAKGVNIHVIGFAKLAGDLIHGLIKVFSYFAIAAGLVSLIIYAYTRCVRSTLLVIACSLVAVTWQLGLMHLMGYVLDPFSVLVPFLIFAIGVSHGAQKMNGIMQDVGKGTHRYVAARYTFRRLFIAGLTALLADAVGFAVLAIVDIPAIRDLAFQASIGVAVLIFSNLLLLPVLLSYTGVSPSAAQRALRMSAGEHPLPLWFAQFTEPRKAKLVLLVTLAVTLAGLVVAQGLKIGDLDPGAPELRADSEYNRSNAYITSEFELSSDQFAVIVKTPPGGLVSFETLLEMDRLEELLRDVPGVQTTSSAASVGRMLTSAGYEGSPKWITINRDTFVVSDTINNVFTAVPELINDTRTVAPIIAFLTDHKAETLSRVVATVEAFAETHNGPDRQFLLAAGSAGIEAATNSTVEKANYQMLALVYAAVIVLCYITFRSWRAVLVAVIPLAVTSVLAEALMVILGIGVKVATLPVIALGVGIGIDYSLYLLTVYLAQARSGKTVRDAYLQALVFTGKVVALIGITLAAAVFTWLWSPIKFQADMGVLLAFMFLWNMVGALILVPSLATFLLKPSSEAVPPVAVEAKKKSAQTTAEPI